MKVITIATVILHIYVMRTLANKSCNNFETCGSCIGYSGERCVWCSEITNSERRCQSEAYLNRNERWCGKKYVYNPEMVYNNSSQTDKSVPVMNLDQSAANITLTPTVKLRPGVEFKFQMKYNPAEDFPLDVYYLMDFSHTMKKHLQELRTQANYVYNILNKFTNNVRFGVGSFVEKPDFPYVDPNNQTAYSFKNHLSLSNDIKAFENILLQPDTGSNFDTPEAGLDGLMQVMSCQKELGWRPDARRIIVLCTDATYHSAGAGKMVRAEKPNDMLCHLNNNSLYDHSLILDYPSVSQIADMASKGNFRIIFVAPLEVSADYKALAKEIIGARYAQLKKQSNIVDIIKTAYLELVRYVMIKHQLPSYMQLTLNPDCTILDFCDLTHKKAIVINATLKVNQCPEDGTKFLQPIEVGVVSGSLHDKLKLTVEIDCKCECERAGSDIQNSSHCGSFGSLQCGICKCNHNRFGDKCQCDGTVFQTDVNNCKQSANETSFCSGRGICVCGKCTCNLGFSGDFCEFNDESCKRRDDKLCSGHGRCTLGACECDKPHWTGDDCSCSVQTDNCYAPYSKEICAGNGECICGECVCNKPGDKQKYSGAFCEDCDGCAEKRCTELESYIYCNHQNNKTYCDQLQQYKQTSLTEVQLLNKSEINNAKWPTAKWCRMAVPNKDEESIVFVHTYDAHDKNLLLFIQKEVEQKLKPNFLIPVGIAIGSVLLLGFLTLLLWKILTDLNDEREYNKFKQKAQEAGFNVSENPLYQPATVNFNNPMFADT